MKKLLIIISIIFIFSSMGYAEMQMWIDKDGVKHFSNTGVPQDVEVESSGEIEYDEERTARLEAIADEKAYMKAKGKAIEDQKKSKQERAQNIAIATAKANEKKQAKIIAMEEKRLEERLSYYQHEYYTEYKGTFKKNHREQGKIAEKYIKEKLRLLKKDPEHYFYSKSSSQSTHSSEHTYSIPKHQNTIINLHTGTAYTHTGAGNYINTKTGSVNIHQGGGQYLDTQTGEIKRLE